MSEDNERRRSVSLPSSTEPEQISEHACTHEQLRRHSRFEWLAAAARLPGRALHIAVVVDLLSPQGAPRPIHLTNQLSSLFGVDRNAKYRALAWLEQAGLISIERKVGRSPVVQRHGGPNAAPDDVEK